MTIARFLALLGATAIVASASFASAADPDLDAARPLTLQRAYDGLQSLPEGGQVAEFASWLEQAQARRGNTVQLVIYARTLDEAVRRSQWRQRVASRLDELFN